MVIQVNAETEKNRMRATDIAVIGVCAALYAVVGRLTDFGVTFIGVAFWPAAVIPAIFAALYGPWVGGTSAAIGIFARDVLFHGDPLLSLVAGVPPNFIMFFIIGYISQRPMGMKKLTLGAVIAAVVVSAGLLLPTLVLPAEFTAVTGGLSTWVIVAVFVSTVGLSLAVITYASKRWPEWRSYAVGSIIGQGVGAAVLSVAVWGYSQLFFSAGGYFKEQLQSSLIPAIFIWTFATEIPFVLLVGPPVIKACYNAFPSLRRKETKSGYE
jgi:small-conductance mechanosensitive channel